MTLGQGMGFVASRRNVIGALDVLQGQQDYNELHGKCHSCEFDTIESEMCADCRNGGGTHHHFLQKAKNKKGRYK